MIVGGRRRYFSRLGAAYLKLWERSIKGDERSTQSFIGLAKALGSLEEPIPTKPSQELTDEMIRQLSDEDLELLVKVEERKKRHYWPRKLSLQNRAHTNFDKATSLLTGARPPSFSAV